MELKYKNWGEININTFNKIKDLFNKKVEKEEDILNTNIELLTILTGEDENKILDLKQSEFNDLLKKTDFLKEVPKVDIRTEYIIENKKYELITNLKKITAGQYIDYQNFIKDGYDKMANIIAIFLVPKGKKYGEDYDVLEFADYLNEHLPYVDAMAIFGFFFVQFKISMKIIVDSLERNLKKQMKREKDKKIKIKIGRVIIQMRELMKGLQNDGDGLTMLTKYRNLQENLGA